MASGTFFGYYYGGESDQFPFYRIPQQLIAGKDFQHVSAEAKLLYGLLLDRMDLSAKNGCGLVERVKQGQGRPAKIYVKRLAFGAKSV